MWLLTSCSLEPRYHLSPREVPAAWKGTQNEDEQSLIEDRYVENWWEIFDEPILNGLEEFARANNPEIYTAVERVFAARATAGIRGADLYPQLNLTPLYNNMGLLIKTIVPSGIANVPTANIPTSTNDSNSVFRYHSITNFLPLTLSYELDLFGRVWNTEQAALRNLQAERMSLQAAQLVLSSDLATSYFQLRLLDSQIKLLKETVRSRQDGLDVNKERYDLGFINLADVTRAETLLYNAEAEQLNFEAQRAVLENRIAVLMGIPPSEFALDFNPLQMSPPRIPAGVPSEILLQRPDIREAERRAAAEHALIGVANASFFPSISLTGTLGFLSPDLKHFLTWLSRFWSIGATMNEPIFDGYRNVFNVELAYAQFRAASGVYQQTILVAFREVEDALVNIQYLAMESDKLQRSVEAAQQTTLLSKDRYLNGLVNFLEVSDSEHMELETQIRYIGLLGQQYTATIQLLKALGGSWQMAEECVE
jgi:multidrug efflux system outer membrane protein